MYITLRLSLPDDVVESMCLTESYITGKTLTPLQYLVRILAPARAALGRAASVQIVNSGQGDYQGE